MIKDWLQRKATVAEFEVAHMVTDERLGPEPVPFGFMSKQWRALLEQMKPGDELWEFCSPPHSWAIRCGHAGVALVRNGKVLGEVITRVN